MILLCLAACRKPEKIYVVADDREIDPENFPGLLSGQKYTLIYAWTSWCGPCRHSLREHLPVYRARFDNLGLDVNITTILFAGDMPKNYDQLIANLHHEGFSNLWYQASLDLPYAHKSAMNTLFANNLEGYEKSKGVPVILLVNNESRVLKNDFPNSIKGSLDSFAKILEAYLRSKD